MFSEFVEQTIPPSPPTSTQVQSKNITTTITTTTHNSSQEITKSALAQIVVTVQPTTEGKEDNSTPIENKHHYSQDQSGRESKGKTSN